MIESSSGSNQPEAAQPAAKIHEDIPNPAATSLDTATGHPVAGPERRSEEAAWPSPDLTAALMALDRPDQRPYGWADAAESLGGGLMSTEGRTARSEYWMGSAILAAIWIPITLALFALAGSKSLVVVGCAVLGLIVWLPFVAFVEALRAVRRLHDSGRSGWLVLLALVPFGLIGLVWLLTRPADPGYNRFGLMSQPDWNCSMALAS